MFRFMIVFIVLACACSEAEAQVREDKLTLEKTLRYVYHENPSLVASRFGYEATKELYPRAISGWRPKISAETSITSTDIEAGNFSSGDGATTKSASISLEQPLFRGFRTVSETESAEKRIEAGAALVRQVEQDIFLETVESYMSVIRDRLLLSLQKQNKKILARERESVAARFEAGDITQTDVKQTEAKYSSALASDAAAESKLRESEAVFEEVTGLWPSGEMEMPAIAFQFPANMDEMVKIAALQNPELIRSRNESKAAQSDIDVARSDYYPQITAFASHVKEYDPQPGIVDETETSAIGVRARLSLYEGGNTLSRTREAKNRASQRFYEIRRVEQSVKSDLVAYWRRYQSYDAEISARELEVEASKFSRDGVREEARLGERTVLDTLEADQGVIDAEAALVRAKSGRIITAYRLAAALGLLLPEHMGMQDIAYRYPAE